MVKRGEFERGGGAEFWSGKNLVEQRLRGEEVERGRGAEVEGGGWAVFERCVG